MDGKRIVDRGWLRRIWLCVLAGMVLFSIQDILLWQRIFEANEMWEFVGTYHEGWFIMLWALIAMGFLWTRCWRTGLLHATMMVTLAFGGLPDVLYYWLRALPIPARLPWLDAHPLILFSPVTSINLLFSTGLWIGFWLTATILMSNGIRITLRKRLRI